MILAAFLDKLQQTPSHIGFTDTMAVIETNYDFTETAFDNGAQKNRAGENNGSCKIFAFAKLNKLSAEQTLMCFGDYYREDVLAHPERVDHQNIRQFMQHGWEGISFYGQVLSTK